MNNLELKNNNKELRKCNNSLNYNIETLAAMRAKFELDCESLEK